MRTSIPPVSRRSFLGLSTLGAAAVAVGAAGCANNSLNAGSTGSAISDKASIVFRNGTIQTMVKEGDTAAALAVSGNKIIYVGEDSGVDEYIDDNTRVIDLDGGMVTPGFMDGHIHAPGNWVTALYEIDLTKGTTIDEYKKAISDFIAKHPDDKAYVGGSFMINAFEQEDGTNPGPNKSILDEICSDKPIMLCDVSYHSVWGNSRALELAGIDNDTPNPTGAIITRDANGEATGYLIDSAATMVREVVSVEHTDKELENAIDKYQQAAAKYGITGITNLSAVGASTAQDCQFYTDLEKDGKLNLRMRVLPTIVPGMTAKEALKTVKDLKKFDSNMISTGTVKIFSDGVTEGGSAVAQLLSGKVNPSGRLAITFPVCAEQQPVYYNQRQAARPKSGRYQNLQHEPMYPFGYGLSYTTFDYGTVRLDRETLRRGERLTAEVEVTNGGAMDGKETVMWFLSDPTASISRPVRELKHFEKQFIPAGESRVFRFEIDPERDLSFPDHTGKRLLENGTFYLHVNGQKVKFELI